MKSRRANAVLFGFDFQRNAAIVLMLEHIRDLRSVRMEGNEEDIELTLENGQKILAQAKAIEKSSSDFSNVRANLKKALISLSEGNQKTNAQQLIFITNSPNPFNDADSRSVFGGLPTRRSFDTLPPSAQKIVKGYLTDIENPLDLGKFTVQVFPFETDDDAEKYKAVKQVTDDFIGSLNYNASPGIGAWLLQVWHDQIFINGTKKMCRFSWIRKALYGLFWYTKQILIVATKVSLINLILESMKKSHGYMVISLTPAVNVSNSLQRFSMTIRSFPVLKSRWTSAKTLLLVPGKTTNLNSFQKVLMTKHWRHS